LRRFDENRPFRPWFATIVANQARNWKRSRGRRLRLVQRIAVQAQLPERFVEQIVLEADEGSRVVAALQALDQHDREILALRFLVGLSERESADALGLALGTVKSRTSRALERMRTQWESANDIDRPTLRTKTVGGSFSPTDEHDVSSIGTPASPVKSVERSESGYSNE
jgi:RNA polymerase sigma factor (sigma-70 family)